MGNNLFGGEKMGRQARKYSQTGMYHIVFRGISRQNVFEEEKDYVKILNMIQKLKQEMNFEIYAYCLMNNHVHLLLKECNMGDISLIMRRLLTKYVGWFNRKYSRSGVLIANRYKSCPIEFSEYLLSVVRYIHYNPIKAKMVANINEYKWSSYSEYINKYGITDTEFVLTKFENSIDAFSEFHRCDVNESYHVSDRIGKSEEYVRLRIMKLTGGKEPHEIAKLVKIERNEIIKQLRRNEKFSIRQIERATGISRGIIAKVDK